VDDKYLPYESLLAELKRQVNARDDEPVIRLPRRQVPVRYDVVYFGETRVDLDAGTVERQPRAVKNRFLTIAYQHPDRRVTAFNQVADDEEAIRLLHDLDTDDDLFVEWIGRADDDPPETQAWMMKRVLRQMASDGWSRPGPDTPDYCGLNTAAALARYTDPEDPEYDQSFAEVMHMNRPDWFGKAKRKRKQ
jgi:hypothetical protein